MKDLKTLDITNLKAEAYDVLATIEKLQAYLKEINAELQEKFQQAQPSESEPAQTTIDQEPSKEEKPIEPTGITDDQTVNQA